MRYIVDETEQANYVLLNDDDEEKYKGQKVAILFCTNNDPDCWDILFHGDPAKVQAKYEILVEEYIDAGFPDIAQSLYKICGEEWYVEELNNCLEISGYIRLFLEKNNIDIEPFKCYAKNGFESIELRELKDYTEEFHKSHHNEFTYWGNCKKEPCASNYLKTVTLNLDGNK